MKFELFFRSRGRQFDQKIQMPHPTSLRPNMCYHASYEIKTSLQTNVLQWNDATLTLSETAQWKGHNVKA